MAVIHKTGSKKMLALGDPSFGMGDYAVPGLPRNQHFSVTIPVPSDDEDTPSHKVLIVRFTMEEVDTLISVRNEFRQAFERD
jgi:hypothetical protein